MKIHHSLVAIAVLMITSRVCAQQLFQTSEFNYAITKQTRTSTGKPGKNYWQNRGYYNIHVNFDPSSNLLSGSEIISYYNNSPDTLNELIIRLYPDLYKKGVERLSEIDEKDMNDGVTIDSFEIGNEIISNFSNTVKDF